MPEVLVIDDDSAQLSVRAAVLRDAGFSVKGVASAEEALDWLAHDASSRELRVIVTDHVLPGASGAAFARSLRDSRPAVRVFVVTGMDEAEPEYSGLGVTFLHKPCPPEELISKVREALRGEV
jgi:DNA-binding response OmpR family regulator